MSKINIKATIKQNGKKEEEIEATALLENNEITYLYNGIATILDIKEQKIRRVTEKLELIIDFENELIITDYEECSLDISIKVIKKELEQNKIKIKYEVIDSKDIFEYEIIWRELWKKK